MLNFLLICRNLLEFAKIKKFSILLANFCRNSPRIARGNYITFNFGCEIYLISVVNYSIFECWPFNFSFTVDLCTPSAPDPVGAGSGSALREQGAEPTKIKNVLEDVVARQTYLRGCDWILNTTHGFNYVNRPRLNCFEVRRATTDDAEKKTWALRTWTLKTNSKLELWKLGLWKLELCELWEV